MYKNSLNISQRTACPSVIRSIRCVLNGEVISVYCENHTELINIPRGQNTHWQFLDFRRVQNVVYVLLGISLSPRTMEPTLSSETSAFILQTPGKFPKEYRLHYQSFSPTDAQENLFKRNIKIYIKTAPTCFGVNTIIRERTI